MSACCLVKDGPEDDKVRKECVSNVGNAGGHAVDQLESVCSDLKKAAHLLPASRKRLECEGSRSLQSYKVRIHCMRRALTRLVRMKPDKRN